MVPMSWTSAARRAAAQTVKVAAAGADALRSPKPRIVVLLYHPVGGTTDSPLDLPVALFEQQMSEIAARTTSLDAALDELSEQPPPSERDLVVTFDDGTAD